MRIACDLESALKNPLVIKDRGAERRTVESGNVTGMALVEGTGVSFGAGLVGFELRRIRGAIEV